MTTFSCEFIANNKYEVENWEGINREQNWQVSLLGTVRTMTPLVIGGKEKFSPKYLLDYLKDVGTEKDIKSSIFMCEERGQEDFDCKISVGSYKPEVISKEVLTLHFDKDGKYTGYTKPNDSDNEAVSNSPNYIVEFGESQEAGTYWYVYNENDKNKDEILGVIWDDARGRWLQESWPVPAICEKLCVRYKRNVVSSLSGKVAFKCDKRVLGTGTLTDGSFSKIESTQKVEDIGSWDEASKTFTFNDKITEISTNETGLVPVGVENLIGKKVTTIGEDVFKNCKSLKKVEFPAVETIGKNAFMECTSLAGVNIPEAKTIGENVFENCKSLKKVEFPKATAIKIEAFCGCTNLEEVKIAPTAVIVIGVFTNCKKLEEKVKGKLKINDGVVNLTTLLLQIVCGTSYIEGIPLGNMPNLKEIYLGNECIYNNNENKLELKKVPRPLRGAFERLFINQDFIKNYKRVVNYGDEKFKSKRQSSINENQEENSLFKSSKDEKLYPNGEPCLDDIRQTNIGDCWFLSTLSSLVSTNPDEIKKILKDNNEDGTVTVTLRRCVLLSSKFDKSCGVCNLEYGPGSTIEIEINKSVADEFNPKNALWVKMIEKAMAVYLYKGYDMRNRKTKQIGKKGVSIPKVLPGDLPAVAGVALAGKKFKLRVKYQGSSSDENLMNKIYKKIKISADMIIETTNSAESIGLAPNHAHSVLGVILPKDSEIYKNYFASKESNDDRSLEVIMQKKANGLAEYVNNQFINKLDKDKQFVILRNPWGRGIADMLMVSIVEGAKAINTNGEGLVVIEASCLADLRYFDAMTYSDPESTNSDAQGQLNSHTPDNLKLEAIECTNVEDVVKTLGLKFKNSEKEVPVYIARWMLLKLAADDLITADSSALQNQYTEKSMVRFDEKGILALWICGSKISFNKDGNVDNVVGTSSEENKDAIETYDRCKRLCKALDLNFKDKIIEGLDRDGNLANYLESLKNELTKKLPSGTNTNTLQLDVNKHNKYLLVLLNKDLEKLFEAAKKLNLIKEKRIGESITLKEYLEPRNAVSNFLDNYIKDSSEKEKALSKMSGKDSKEQLDILKRFLLRMKKKEEKVKKVLLGDKSEARKVKKCFTEVGKCIKGSKLDQLEEKMKISDWAGWNNINGDLLGKYSGADEKLQVVFMSFIGLKNAKNVIAACDGLKEGGVKGNNDPYVKIRKAIKAECLDENLTQDNLERCIIESFRRYYPSKGAQTVVEVFNCIKRKYKGISWDEPTE